MTKHILLWGCTLIGIAILIVLLAKLGATPPSTGGPLAVPVSDKDHFKGNQNAKTALVEYSDFQCPACAQMYPIVKQIGETFKDDLKIVYRHYPLSQAHKNANTAARASEAAALQGKFWEMHDMLFNTQNEWAQIDNSEAFFVNLATSLGLDSEKFKADLNSRSAGKKISEDELGGVASEVQGTPTFFLNGERIQNPRTMQEFENVIKAAMSK